MSEYSHQYFHLTDPGHLPWFTRLWRRSASSWYAASCCFHCFTLAVDSSRAAVSLALLPLSVASSASQCLLIVELHRQNENGQNPQISSFMLFKSLVKFFNIQQKENYSKKKKLHDWITKWESKGSNHQNYKLRKYRYSIIVKQHLPSQFNRVYL